MKIRAVFVTLFFLHITSTFAALQEAKYKLEIVPFKISLNGGLYRSRIANALPEKRSYSNPAFFIQVYFPFKRSIDHPDNFSEDTGTAKHYDRLFSATPYAIFHVTENFGYCAGVGQELSIRVVKRVYAKIQLALAFTESLPSSNDGLKSGFNFHNFWYLSTFISRTTAVSLGYTHISNGRIFRPSDTSLFDMLTVGVSHSFRRKK